MTVRHRLKQSIVKIVNTMPNGVRRAAAKDWAHGNPTGHQLLQEQVHLKRLFAHLDVDCVFDVGANAGQYATMLRHEIGYTGQIVSFEPIPRHADALKAKAAHDPRWEIHELALSSTSAPAQFSIMARDQFSSLGTPDTAQTSHFAEINTQIETIDLVTQTLDDLMPEMVARLGVHRPFLKMDTQGFDLEVVKGGATVLQRFVGLQSELAVLGLYEGAPLLADVLAAYDERGFGLSALVPNNRGHFPTLMEVDGIFVRKDFLDLH